MKKGRSLELLVEKLERQLASDENVLIESPKKIRDIQTGKLREHDVVLTYNQAHHELLVAIECKDRSRPVGVPDIEAFSNKCRYTNINQGIVVSSSGFAKTALEKADSMGIRCLELKEVESVSFLLPGATVCVHSKRFITASCSPVVDDYKLCVADDYDIFDPDGNLITDEIIKNNIQLIADKLPLGKLGEERTETIYLQAENYYVVTHKRKLKHIITGIVLEIKYVYEISESSFTSMSYSFADQNSFIAEIATAPLNFDDKEKELILIGKKDGTLYRFIS